MNINCLSGLVSFLKIKQRSLKRSDLTGYILLHGLLWLIAYVASVFSITEMIICCDALYSLPACILTVTLVKHLRRH